jgi:hypothetical protein
LSLFFYKLALYKNKTINLLKTIRLLAASLFLLNGVLHFYSVITKGTSDQYFVPALAFGIIYCAIGVLLMLKKGYAIWLGIILLIIPLLMAIFIVGLKTLDTFSLLIVVLDLLGLLSCLVLLLNKNKE